MTHPIVLVLGVDDVLTQVLVEKLTRQKTDEDRCTDWRIVTKYYETKVTVQRALLEEGNEEVQNMNCEALLLAAEMGPCSSFSRAKDWFEKECKGKGYAPPIALVVLNTASGDAEIPKWFEDELPWCIENGFEWIKVSTTDSEVDSRLERDEGHGMHRVGEALQAHIWPGCSLKKQPTTQDTQTTETVSADDAGMTTPAFDEEEDEDGFEKLMTEMTNARERLRTLSDQERRDGAADLAMKLAQYFVDD